MKDGIGQTCILQALPWACGISLAFLILSTFVLAEDQEGFFPPNFVNEELVEEALPPEGETEEEKGSVSILKEDGGENNEVGNLLERAKGEAQSEKKSPAVEQKIEREQSSETVIFKVGVIVKLEKRDSAMRVLDSLSRAADKLRAKLGRIYLIGPFDEGFIRSEAIRSLLLKGAQVAPSLVVPERYKVERSPTWILEAEEGEILLEGFESLEKHINSRGRFVEPAGAP